MRKNHRTNLAAVRLLLLAVLLRLAISAISAPVAPGDDAPSLAADEPVTVAVQAQHTAPDLQIPTVPAAKQSTPSATQAPVSPVTLAMTETTVAAAETLSIRNQTGYTVSLEELAQQALTFDADADGPTVLLIHTHTTEAYTPEAGWEYEASDELRTMDSRYNMIRVGDEVERVLTEAGLWVIHDEQINDYPSYNGSYGASLARIEMWLARYPTIQLVLDLHRDAAADPAGGYVTTACAIDGADAAQLMLVCGTDYGGLPHPAWRGNLAFAVQLQLALEQRDPGVCRPLDLRCERFNQHATPMSLLVEVGTAGDTLARALTAAEALGDALADLLRSP